MPDALLGRIFGILGAIIVLALLAGVLYISKSAAARLMPRLTRGQELMIAGAVISLTVVGTLVLLEWVL